MQEEESRKKLKAGYLIGQDLDLLSVDEIDEAIKSLGDEIKRLQDARNHKESHLSKAEALFSGKQ